MGKRGDLNFVSMEEHVSHKFKLNCIEQKLNHGGALKVPSSGVFHTKGLNHMKEKIKEESTK